MKKQARNPPASSGWRHSWSTCAEYPNSLVVHHTHIERPDQYQPDAQDLKLRFVVFFAGEIPARSAGKDDPRGCISLACAAGWYQIATSKRASEGFAVTDLAGSAVWYS
jgi:hypothetical protein